VLAVHVRELSTRWRARAAGLLVLAVLLTLTQSGMSTPAGPSTPVKPNIVFILTDDQSYDMVDDVMPYLASRPGGDWVDFSNAFVNVPFCCPSRASILTGQYAHHHGINGSNGVTLDDSSTMATWLDDAGYRTGIVGKYLNGYPFLWQKPPDYIAPGWDYWAVFNEVDHYDYSLNENGTGVSYGSAPEDYSTDVLHRKAIEFLDGTDPDDPFLLYLGTHAPHLVNTPAPRHQGRYEDLEFTPPPNFNEADVSDKPAWIQGLEPRPERAVAQRKREAAETLLAVDEAIRGIVEELEARGQLDDTVIVFMTDNGFSFGSHRWGQKLCVYEECVRTPLLVRYPGAGANRVEDRLVSNVDIAPTFADLAGVAPENRVDGQSLVPLLRDEATSWRTSLLLEQNDPTEWDGTPPFWAVRTAEWKYVELETGEKELYDLVRDPYEMENVVDAPDNASIVATLAAELGRLRSD
jgi:N-acetylglucosamine-6-sulfatase